MIDFKMANSKHLAILEQGVEAWNESRTSNPVAPDLTGADLSKVDLTRLDLTNADLTGANLSVANLAQADLTGANLSWASLIHANLSWANLTIANLSQANLTDANLVNANLSYANLFKANLSHAYLDRLDFTKANLLQVNFSWANLSQADLHQANLSYANLNEAMFSYTRCANVDLSSVRGLHSVIHRGPSTIGIDTFYRSNGDIPEVFLRGAGVPDTFITYAKSLIGSAIEFYSCFISYSTKDQDFADRLHADLQAKGVRCWFAPHDMQGGHKIHEQIDDAIRLHDKLLLILSPSSMASEWVKTEISKARKREVRDKARVLFPISLVPFEAIQEWECFHGNTGKDFAEEIREYFIPDFSNWKDHDSYQKAFNRLLKDLKATNQHQA